MWHPLVYLVLSLFFSLLPDFPEMKTSTATSPPPHCDVCPSPHVCKKGVSWLWTETSDVISQIRPVLLWAVLLGVVSQKQRTSKHIYQTVPSVLGARQEPENVVVFLCLDAFSPDAFWPCFISYPACSYYHLFFLTKVFCFYFASLIAQSFTLWTRYIVL